MLKSHQKQARIIRSSIRVNDQACITAAGVGFAFIFINSFLSKFFCFFNGACFHMISGWNNNLTYLYNMSTYFSKKLKIFLNGGFGKEINR